MKRILKDLDSAKMLDLRDHKDLWAFVNQIRSLLIGTSFGTQRRLSVRTTLIDDFIKNLILMDQRHGSTYVVKYMKASMVALQKFLGGEPLTTLRVVEPTYSLPGLRRGLPKIIPLHIRRAIIGGSTEYIRLYVSLFNLYRIIRCEFNPKLSTITGSSTADPNFLKEIEVFFNSYAQKAFSFQLNASLLQIDHTFKSAKSSANWRPSWASPIRDLLAWYTIGPSNLLCYLDFINSSILEDLTKCFSWLDNNGLFNFKIRKDNVIEETKEIPVENTFTSEGEPIPAGSILVKSKTPIYILGRLHYKEEAAGKLRIFAIADFWTQNVLEPLHRQLFKLLKSIPNDATFNQDLSVQRSIEKMKSNKMAYSFDLSAATDRLPLSIQRAILNSFMNGLGDVWAPLVADREFWILKNRYKLPIGPLRYAVGQPMGVLSSWDMLAITHHMIVQMAYYLSYRKDSNEPYNGVWFDQYEVLGDDITIFNKKVAYKYLEIMKLIGVEINLAKSIVSEKGTALEFAKRTIYKGVDVSPLSWKLIRSEWKKNHSARIALAIISLKQRNIPFTMVRLVSCLGPRYLKNLYSSQSTLYRFLSKEIYQVLGNFNVPLSLISLFSVIFTNKNHTKISDKLSESIHLGNFSTCKIHKPVFHFLKWLKDPNLESFWGMVDGTLSKLSLDRSILSQPIMAPTWFENVMDRSRNLKEKIPAYYTEKTTIENNCGIDQVPVEFSLLLNFLPQPSLIAPKILVLDSVAECTDIFYGNIKWMGGPGKHTLLDRLIYNQLRGDVEYESAMFYEKTGNKDYTATADLMQQFRREQYWVRIGANCLKQSLLLHGLPEDRYLRELDFLEMYFEQIDFTLSE